MTADTVVELSQTKDALPIPDFVILLAVKGFFLNQQTIELPRWLLRNWGQFSETLRRDIAQQIDALAHTDSRHRRQGSAVRALGTDACRSEWEKLRKLWREAK